MLRPGQSLDKSRYLAAVTVLVLLVSLTLSSCKKNAGANKNDKKNVVGAVVPAKPATTDDASGLPGGGLTGITAATIWFTKSEEDKLTFISEVREQKEQFKTTRDALVFAMQELLAGPKGPAQAEGAGSEIPPGTVLIGISQAKESGDYTINLSRRFAQGSGPDSFEARIEQVKRTVESVAAGTTIYLDVEGKRLEASSEGIEVKQPINSSSPVDPTAEAAAAAAASGAVGAPNGAAAGQNATVPAKPVGMAGSAARLKAAAAAAANPGAGTGNSAGGTTNSPGAVGGSAVNNPTNATSEAGYAGVTPPPLNKNKLTN